MFFAATGRLREAANILKPSRAEVEHGPMCTRGDGDIQMRLNRMLKAWTKIVQQPVTDQ